jgi:hypothetical protein
MTDLAKLVVRLEAQSAQFLAELQKTNRQLDRFASQTHKTLMKWTGNVIGAFSVKAMADFSLQVLKTEGDLVAMAEKSGSTVEEISRLGHVADLSASNLDTLTAGLKALANRAEDAAKKGGASAAAFNKLGINVRNSDGSLKNSTALLLEIADQFQQYEDGAAKSALATDLLSKAGEDLIPFLNRGAAGIEEVAKQADAMGITVSTDAAQAANQFGDELTTLGAITRGVVGKALAEVVPILSKWNQQMIEDATGAERLDKTARTLAAGLKILVSAGAIVGAVFDAAGNAIGGVIAGVVAVLHGDFRRADAIYNQMVADTVQKQLELGKTLVEIWTTTGEGMAKAAEDAGKKVKKHFSFLDPDAVKEITIGVNIQKTGTPTEKFFEDLQSLTRTSSEAALSAYYEQREALQVLFDTGKIGAAQFEFRLEEINKKLEEGTGITERQTEALERQNTIAAEGKAVYESTLTPLEQYNAELLRLSLLLQQNAIDQETYNRAVRNAKFAYEDATDSAGAFFRAAAHASQDILGRGIADSIRYGFNEGAKGALRAFGDMIIDMTARAVAADLMNHLFGEQLGFKGTGTGWLGALASFFGGTKDSGGPGHAGVAYAIGTGAQPEIFVPDTPGHFYPRGEGLGDGSPMVVNNRFSITTERGDRVTRQTEQQVAAAASRGLAMASRRNN